MTTIQLLVLIGAILTFSTQLMILVSSILNRKKIMQTREEVKELTIRVDGRLTELLEANRISDLALGKLAGVQEERNRPMIPLHDTHSKPQDVKVVNEKEDPLPVVPVK